MSTFPDYYDSLGVTSDATLEDIREAYKLRALETHPDRLTNSSSVSREEAKLQFQRVADAYYVLSDPSRRSIYDARYRAHKQQHDGELTSSDQAYTVAQTNADETFGSVFEELLKPEVENPSWFYAPIGCVAGGIIGFITANVPGAMAGAYAGKQLGAVRDAKGMSVFDAFQRLPSNDKAAVLAQLASRLLTGAVKKGF